MKKYLILSIIILGCFRTLPLMAQQINLSLTEFEKGLGDKNVQLLDVRTSAEFQAGYLRNAMQANWNDQPEFIKRTASLDKTRPVYTYCLSGVRSNSAATWLSEQGYKAYNLAGGMLAWKKAGKPIEQPVAVIQMTAAEYNRKISSSKTVLVDFGAGWCPPCIKMAPVLDSLSSAYPGRFALVKIDGSAQTEIATKMNVTAFPLFIIYKNGREVWRKEGIVDASEFMKFL